jgi:nitrite reductase/ring-hydroxylating ferredoxin subunit
MGFTGESEMPFVENMWYVAAWSHELNREKPIGRTIIGEPIVLYRRGDGCAIAFEDRCAHRHAPLSRGRIEGDNLRCMYHGLLYASDGQCRSIPGGAAVAPGTAVRAFPTVEQSSWIWVWMGDASKADSSTIPSAVGLDNPEWVMRASAMDYEADYQLVNDNLCDLSHLDFVHETTLGLASGSKWSLEQPRISSVENGLLIERWFVDRVLKPKNLVVDAWNSYRYLLPGIFLMDISFHEPGTATSSNFAAPRSPSLFRRCDQQAITPICEGRSRYLYATGTDRASASPETLERMFTVLNSAFSEDREIIEAQQLIWNANSSASRPMAFIPQDKAPSMFRRKLSNLISLEQSKKHSADSKSSSLSRSASDAC